MGRDRPPSINEDAAPGANRDGDKAAKVGNLQSKLYSGALLRTSAIASWREAVPANGRATR
jgi:hypothetical protein